MPQPKPSTTEMSMPTFETLEEWTRSQIQSLIQSVLDEEVTHALGRFDFIESTIRAIYEVAGPART